jgi:predicted O-methyltransferase YrrM
VTPGTPSWSRALAKGRLILDEAVAEYLAGLHLTPDPVQAEMERLARERDFPIVGPVVGRLLFTIATAIGARRVFEMGSGYGYSALHFARAVGPAGEGGEVVLTEGDAANIARAQDFLGRAGLADRCRFEAGDAREVIGRYAGPWDVVYIDVDKEQYPACLRLARPVVRRGGLIIADNALWFGRVADPADTDPTTEGIREYLRLAFGDPGLATTVVPLRDGVAVSLVL